MDVFAENRSDKVFWSRSLLAPKKRETWRVRRYRNQGGIDFPERSLVPILFRSSFVNVSTGRATSRSAVSAAPDSVIVTHVDSQFVSLCITIITARGANSRESRGDKSSMTSLFPALLFCVSHSLILDCKIILDDQWESVKPRCRLTL